MADEKSVSTEVKSVLAGVAMLGIGLVLYLTAGDIQTPVISLSKIGVVLMFLGGLELVVTVGYNVWKAITKK